MNKKEDGRMMMSSCVTRRITFQKNTSLQACPDDSPPKHHRKMLSFFHPARMRGAISVEAAIALPIFIFFFVNLLSLFLTYEKYSENLSNLHQTAKMTALAAHVTRADDVVKLKKIQVITPISSYIGFQGSTTTVCANVRKWTGYNPLSGREGINEEEYVYITESGTVYHRSRDCKHLKVSIQVIPYSEIDGARNENGAKYYKCDRCGKYNSSGVVFITNQGNKYHTSATCSGLKRTIMTVKITETGGRGPCSSCA